MAKKNEELPLQKCYSFWGGVKYIIGLSLMLWWLPFFGQMIAGYIGGRKVGTPLKAIAAALIPMDIVLVINILMHSGPIATALLSVPTKILGLTSTYLPFAIPYIQFSFLYLATYFMSINKLMILQPSAYSIVVIFAFIGGLMAEQTRKEITHTLERMKVSPVVGGKTAKNLPKPVPKDYVVVESNVKGDNL